MLRSRLPPRLPQRPPRQSPTKPDTFVPRGRSHQTPRKGYGSRMAIQRNSTKPASITNESGQPEIVLEIDGLTLSMTPPAQATPAESKDDDED